MVPIYRLVLHSSWNLGVVVGWGRIFTLFLVQALKCSTIAEQLNSSEAQSSGGSLPLEFICSRHSFAWALSAPGKISERSARSNGAYSNFKICQIWTSKWNDIFPRVSGVETAPSPRTTRSAGLMLSKAMARVSENEFGLSQAPVECPRECQ